MTLYLTDLDGTLLNYRSEVKHRAAEMLARFVRQGVLFSYATARSFNTASALTAEIGINIPVITMNGVMICDGKTGDALNTCFLGEKRTLFTKKTLCELKQYPLVYADIDGKRRVSYYQKEKQTVEYYLNMRKGDTRLRPCKTLDELYEGEVYYVTLIDPTCEVDNLRREINAENGFGTNYQLDNAELDCWWFEMFGLEASKANAALKLKEMLEADELVTFGDNMNDIPMLKAADRGYAVRNAVKEAKEAATGVIESNEECAVPLFIECEICEHFDYTPLPSIVIEPDKTRFEASVERARQREISTIGTLNEKMTHNALKGYFTSEFDHEAKIAGYYADAVSENGIYEIQTANFGKLREKLEAFLGACHVTVVYPYEKRTNCVYVNKNTGELIKRSAGRTAANYSKLFIELYRIKSFLTNPNLTICIAELETDKIRYVDDEKCVRKRGQKVEKIPKRLIDEIYLQRKEDYLYFTPENLPESFTKAELSKLYKKCDASILLEILEYMTVVHKLGKKGNAFVYSLTPKE